MLRNQHSQQSNLEDTQVLPNRTPARKNRTADGDEAELSIEDVLLKIIRAARFIRRNAWLILTFAVTGIGLGAASFKFYPPVRAAQCIVTLHSAPRTNPIEPEAQRAQSDSMHFFVGAERTFTSTETIMATLKRIGIPHPTEWEAENIGKRMRLEKLDSDTYVATLTPKLLDRRDESPVKFLDAHVKNYVETEIEKKLKVFIAEVDFLRSQTEAADKRLQEISQETVNSAKPNRTKSSRRTPWVLRRRNSKRAESHFRARSAVWRASWRASVASSSVAVRSARPRPCRDSPTERPWPA